MYEDFDEQAIREQIEKRLDARRDFFIHMLIFVGVMGFLWFIWATVNLPELVARFGTEMPTLSDIGEFAPEMVWPLFVTIPWGLGLFIHYLTYYYQHGGGVKRREETVQRELQREMERRGLTKRKHSDRLMLTDDGEINAYDDEYTDAMVDSALTNRE